MSRRSILPGIASGPMPTGPLFHNPSLSPSAQVQGTMKRNRIVRPGRTYSRKYPVRPAGSRPRKQSAYYKRRYTSPGQTIYRIHPRRSRIHNTVGGSTKKRRPRK